MEEWGALCPTSALSSSACILAREGRPGGLSFRSPAQGGSPGSPLFGRLGRALGGAGGAWGWEAGGR